MASGMVGEIPVRLLFVAIACGVLLALQARGADAAVTVPSFGNFYTDKSTITSNAGPESDPFHDLANDCNYNYPLPEPLPNIPDFVNYLSIMADGAMYGQCEYTDHYANVTERQNGSFTGTLNVNSGTFSATVINSRTYDVATDPPRKQTFGIELDIQGGTIGANGFATGTATFKFNYACTGSCSETDSYTGTIKYNLATKPANAADFRIDHIEVVQVVQDANNTVPLVANKTTAVRVFPTANATVIGAKVKLMYEGEEVSTAAVDVTPGEISRKEASLSANFEFPFELTLAGEVTLVAEVLPPDGWSDTNEANDTKPVTVTFQSRSGLFVDYIKVCHQLNGQGEPNCPRGDVTGMEVLAQEMFPLADDALVYDRIVTPVWIYKDPLSTLEDENAFLAALRKRYDFISPPAGVTSSLADQVLAWLPPGLSIEGGASDPKWDTANDGVGRVFYLQKVDVDALSLQIAFAHEVAHNLGRRHPDVDGGCGAKDEDNTDWPYPDGHTNEVGFWISKSMIVPDTWNDLMTYCDDRWISDHNYTRLFERNFSTQSLGAQGATTNFLIVSGMVEAGGGSGSLDPAYQVQGTGVAPSSNPAGNTCLEFSGGGSPSEFCFDLAFEGGENSAPLQREAFTLKVAAPAGTTRVALMSGPTELDSLEAAGAAPTLDITSPQGGETLTGEQAITWSANDSDGDQLRYTILASYNGGLSWTPIEVDTAASEFSFDTAELAGGDAMFKVLASDGLNTTTDLVEVSLGEPRPWGDIDCNTEIDPVDSLKILRDDAGLPNTQPEGCPGLGDSVNVPGVAGAIPWGDVDCNGDVDPVDSLKILRDDAGLPTTPVGGCPALGDPVVASPAALTAWVRRWRGGW